MKNNGCFYWIVSVEVLRSTKCWVYFEDRADIHIYIFFFFNWAYEFYKREWSIKNDFKLFGLSTWKNWYVVYQWGNIGGGSVLELKMKNLLLYISLRWSTLENLKNSTRPHRCVSSRVKTKMGSFEHKAWLLVRSKMWSPVCSSQYNRYTING